LALARATLQKHELGAHAGAESFSIRLASNDGASTRLLLELFDARPPDDVHAVQAEQTAVEGLDRALIEAADHDVQLIILQHALWGIQHDILLC
jgi:hypothetical protein